MTVSCSDDVDPNPICFPTLDGGSLGTRIPTNRRQGGTVSVYSEDGRGNNASEVRSYTMDWTVYGTYAAASGDAGTIVRFYIATFGRLPDPGGFAFWSGQLAADPGALPDVAAFFTSSPELESLYGTSVTDDDFLDTIYLNVLGRSACLLYTSPSPRDATLSRMPSSA